MHIPSPSADIASKLKKTRSGRHVVPPLAWWRNQNRRCDVDGNLIEITEGSKEFTAPSELYTTPAIRIEEISPIKPKVQIVVKPKEPIPTDSNVPKKRKLWHNFSCREKPSFFFSDLPNEILFYIFGFLDAEDLCNISPVCKQWKNFAGDEVLWKDLYFRYCTSMPK